MLENLTPPVRTYTCKVAKVAANLEEKDRAILMAAVDNPEWHFKTLSNELSKRGIIIIDNTIARHRRRQCGCFRK